MKQIGLTKFNEIEEFKFDSIANICDVSQCYNNEQMTHTQHIQQRNSRMSAHLAHKYTFNYCNRVSACICDNLDIYLLQSHNVSIH